MSKKLAANLKRRTDNYLPTAPSGQKTHKPGSQNRNKGYGMSRGNR